MPKKNSRRSMKGGDDWLSNGLNSITSWLPGSTASTYTAPPASTYTAPTYPASTYTAPTYTAPTYPAPTGSYNGMTNGYNSYNRMTNGYNGMTNGYNSYNGMTNGYNGMTNSKKSNGVFGGKKRSCKSKKMRGGSFTDNTPTSGLAFNAAPFSGETARPNTWVGGKTKKRSKRTKSCRKR